MLVPEVSLLLAEAQKGAGAGDIRRRARTSSTVDEPSVASRATSITKHIEDLVVFPYSRWQPLERNPLWLLCVCAGENALIKRASSAILRLYILPYICMHVRSIYTQQHRRSKINCPLFRSSHMQQLANVATWHITRIAASFGPRANTICFFHFIKWFGFFLLFSHIKWNYIDDGGKV